MRRRVVCSLLLVLAGCMTLSLLSAQDRTHGTPVGQPPGQPAPYLFRRAGRLALLLGTHVIMITRQVAPRNDFSPTRGHQPLPAQPGPAGPS